MPKRFGTNISTSDAITVIAAPDADAGAVASAGVVAVANSDANFARAPSYDTTVSIFVNGVDETTVLRWGETFTILVVVSAPVSLEGLSIPWTISETTYLDSDPAYTNSSSGTMTITVDQQDSVVFKLLADPKQDIEGVDVAFTINPGTSQEQIFTLSRPLSKAVLYDFTTHTFTNAGATGWTGPTLASLQSAYSSETWEADPELFTEGDIQGEQIWTIPETATYTILARGAGGGRSNGWGQNGGAGAAMTAQFNLSLGDKLKIIVGQAGLDNYYDAGGGGGSFVSLLPAGGGDEVLLIAAAGGGGGAPSGFSGGGLLGNTNSGRVENAGSNTSWATGGANGLGGGNGSTAGGGGGWLGGGSSNWGGARGNGGGVINDPRGNSQQSDGGFGGGGAGGGTNGAGGGGGYGGGASAPWSYRGGGGGSYYNSELFVDGSFTGITGNGASGQSPGTVQITKET